MTTGALCITAENAAINHLHGTAYTPAATLYLALSTADPSNDDTGLTEPSGTYARQAISFNAASGRQIENTADITFPEAEASWGDVTHWAVCDAQTAGNVLARGQFDGTKTVSAGIAPKIYAGDIWIAISASGSNGQGITDYAANALLDLIFRNQSFAIAGLAVALLAAETDDTAEDIATDCTETTGTGYTQITVNEAGGASPAFNAASDGAVTNADLIDWGTPGADDWSIVAALALVTDAGKVLTYDNNIADFTPLSSDTVSIATGSYQAALH
jgi:hypothetical protein